MNVSLGAPYVAIIDKMIARGFAASQTEVIRQALLLLDRESQEEEARLVHKGVQIQMEKIRTGKVKTHSLEKVLKEAGLD